MLRKRGRSRCPACAKESKYKRMPEGRENFLFRFLDHGQREKLLKATEVKKQSDC